MEKNSMYQGTTGAPYQLDFDIEQELTAFLAKHPPRQIPEKGDWQTLREISNDFYNNLNRYIPEHEDVQTQIYTCVSFDGTEIALRWYAKTNGNLGPAVVYVHGGGRIAGSITLYDPIVANFVHLSGVPFLAVEYRIPPEGKDEILAEDAFAAILWLKENAATLGVTAHRIAIMGDSGGGGIAASATILARDRGIHLAKQILLYPMLDDRNIVPDDKLLPFAVWNYENNYTGWRATMSQEPGSNNVSAIISPARLDNFSGLAPAYIIIGFLDIFRDEAIAFAQQLMKAGVPTELHVHPGAPHAFDFLAPGSAVAKRAITDHIRVIQSF